MNSNVAFWAAIINSSVWASSNAQFSAAIAGVWIAFALLMSFTESAMKKRT